MTKEGHNRRDSSRNANRTILRRTVFLMVVFGVGIFIPLLWKLWDIQVVNHDYYLEQAIKQQTANQSVSATRGSIYDTNGVTLAISITAYNVVVSPKIVADLQESYNKAVQDAASGQGKYPDYPEPTNELIAAGLSAILDADESDIYERLAKTWSWYEVIKSSVGDDIAEQVNTFVQENKLSNSVYLEEISKRIYPHASLASHVIGFLNSNNEGYGLESRYNSLLSGEFGQNVTFQTGQIGNRRDILSPYDYFAPVVNGSDLHLTLDANIQAMLEKTLVEGIERYDAQYGGFAIALDPNSGAVLGMASSYEYDLNNYGTIADPTIAEELAQIKMSATEDEYSSALYLARVDQWCNKAVSYTYEPGSTFKALVLAAALEEGVVNETDTFYCPGYAFVAGEKIDCNETNGHETQSLAQAVENSCNPAFIEIGQRLGADKFYDYLERYNMIGTTGIDLPSETNNENLVWPREKFNTVNLATASFGQRFNVTPIQLIAAFASVINGGHLYEPYVVQSTTDSNGNITYQHEVTEIRQVVSSLTSEKVRTILEGVVDGGGGKNAYVAGYRIGGKTGTSETLAEDKHNIVSFVGFAPANDPRVIVLLAYDAPKRSSQYSQRTEGGYFISGGAMAAPMAGELIADILDYMGVEKQYKPEELSGADTMVPQLKGHYLDYAETLVKQAGLTYRTVGEGDVVTGQIPASGLYIPGSSQVVIYLGNEVVPTDQVEVPNLIGLTPEEVQRELNNAGLYLRASGAVEYYVSSNKAINQSIDSGALVDRGTVVEVHFVDDSVQDYAPG